MHNCYTLTITNSILLYVGEIKKAFRFRRQDKTNDMRPNCWDEFTGLFPECRLTQLITTLSIQEDYSDPRSS